MDRFSKSNNVFPIDSLLRGVSVFCLQPIPTIIYKAKKEKWGEMKKESEGKQKKGSKRKEEKERERRRKGAVAGKGEERRHRSRK